MYISLVKSPARALDGQEDSTLLAELSATATPLSAVCMKFNTLNTKIRDNRIASAAAKRELAGILTEIRTEYSRAGGGEYPRTDWYFPLEGYDGRAIGGGRRHGYAPRGYDFFSGNRHGGHPSYDIFIRDRNQDSRDDRNGQAVPVRSMTGGVVVALEKEWVPGSALRGGKYIWVYDPAHNLLVYYAHNADVLVDLATIVKPGDQLATVGRTGWNAAKRRSPTHLHLSVMKVQGGSVLPLDVYPDLLRSVKVPDGAKPANKK